METNLQEIKDRILALMQQHEALSNDIQGLKSDFIALSKNYKAPDVIEIPETDMANKPITGTLEKAQIPYPKTADLPPVNAQNPPIETVESPAQRNWEKFIGENISAKIGIVILIIGVSLGIKFSIDNGLLSPLMRVVLSMLSGVTFVFFGLKLKSKYNAFGASLVSTGLAILYLISFAAYAYYNMIPQPVAFVIMLLLTAIAVWLALFFNLQIIAHFGLIGAYLTPFLLSNNSGNVLFLFSYMGLINCGILVLAYYRNWKPILVNSFIFTWGVFLYLSLLNIDENSYLATCLTFSAIYFLTFYFALIAYHFHSKKPLDPVHVILILFNSFVAYSMGKLMLNNHQMYQMYSGIFTLLHALPHLGLAFYVFKTQRLDKGLLYLSGALFISFLTITIPVQFDGNWVTLLWIVEASILFYLARKNNINLFKTLALVLFHLSAISLLQDWMMSYSQSDIVLFAQGKFYYHIRFLSSLFFCAMLGFSNWTATKYPEDNVTTSVISMNKLLSVFLIVIGYLSFFFETQIFIKYGLYSNYTRDVYQIFSQEFIAFWLLIYSFVFVLIFQLWVNIKSLTGKIEWVVFVMQFALVLLFLTLGLWNADIMEISTAAGNFVPAHNLNRYIGLAFSTLSIYHLMKTCKTKPGFLKLATIWVHLLIFTFLIVYFWNEINHLIDINHWKIQGRYIVSLYLAFLSVACVYLGIKWGFKHLRIWAIVLFAFTLLKVLFFDTTGLGGGPKIALYIITGLLLLVISWLYNKFKDKLL